MPTSHRERCDPPQSMVVVDSLAAKYCAAQDRRRMLVFILTGALGEQIKRLAKPNIANLARQQRQCFYFHRVLDRSLARIRRHWVSQYLGDGDGHSACATARERPWAPNRGAHAGDDHDDAARGRPSLDQRRPALSVSPRQAQRAPNVSNMRLAIRSAAGPVDHRPVIFFNDAATT